MMTITENGVTKKYISAYDYQQALKALGSKQSLDIMSHALDILMQSENNVGDNPYFKQVGRLRHQIKQMKDNLVA